MNCNSKLYLIDKDIPHPFIQRHKLNIPNQTYFKDLQENQTFLELPKNCENSVHIQNAIEYSNIHHLCKILDKNYNKFKIIVYIDFDSRIKTLKKLLSKKIKLLFYLFEICKVQFYLITDKLMMDKSSLYFIHKLSICIPNIKISNFIFVDKHFSTKNIAFQNHITAECDNVHSPALIREIIHQIIS
jgi:hypothetical protein